MSLTETSTTRPLQVDFLPSEALPLPGKIGMTMAPGKQEQEAEITWKRDLAMDLDRLWHHYGVDRLVCLLEPEEFEVLGIPDLLKQAVAQGIATDWFPISDTGTPASAEQFAALIDRTLQAVQQGQTVAIHCKGGRGRTGMVAACCLVQLGTKPEAAIHQVQQSRVGALQAAIKQDYVLQFQPHQPSYH